MHSRSAHAKQIKMDGVFGQSASIMILARFVLNSPK
jgi:hypothetical protein